MTGSDKGRPSKFVLTPQGEIRTPVSFRQNILTFYRDVIRAVYLIRLELKQQSFGLSLGYLWLVLEPALQAGTYYFLLKVVFRMDGGDSTFAFFLVAIIFWRSHAALTTSAPSFLISKGYHYIDQGFGLKMAFFEFVGQEFVLFLVRFMVLLMFLVLAGYSPGFSWFAGLLVGVVMFAFTLGFSVWLALLGMLVKDAMKLVGHFVWLWWYMSPGLYGLDRIPIWAEPIFAVNPFSYIIPAAHSVLLGGEYSSPNYMMLLLILLMSIILISVGSRLLVKFSYVVARYV